MGGWGRIRFMVDAYGSNEFWYGNGRLRLRFEELRVVSACAEHEEKKQRVYPQISPIPQI